MDSLKKAQEPNCNFKRLYWNTHKKEISEILQKVNLKYLIGLKYKFRLSSNGTNGTRLYLRYNGYEFQVSWITIRKELNRRNENIIS